MNTCNLHISSRSNTSIIKTKDPEFKKRDQSLKNKKDGFATHQKRIQHDWPLYLSHLNNEKFLDYKARNKLSFLKLGETSSSSMVDNE